MDTTTLVAPQIEEGRRLLDLLKESGIDVSAALWDKDFFDRWGLTIVTPLVDEIGILNAYLKLRKLMDNTKGGPRIDLSNLQLLSPKSPYAKSLRKVLKSARDKNLVDRYFGDHHIKEGYVYFVR